MADNAVGRENTLFAKVTQSDQTGQMKGNAVFQDLGIASCQNDAEQQSGFFQNAGGSIPKNQRLRFIFFCVKRFYHEGHSSGSNSDRELLSIAARFFDILLGDRVLFHTLGSNAT